VIVEQFKPYHIELLMAQGVQEGQVRQVSHVPVGWASVGTMLGSALTARDGDRILLCGGVMPVRPKIGVLWAVLSAEAGSHMLWLHRATQRFISIAPPRRLEATVEKGFPQGCRWLELLGFEFESERRCYGLDDETHLAYVKIT
jgi:hypothetical protein